MAEDTWKHIIPFPLAQATWWRILEKNLRLQAGCQIFRCPKSAKTWNRIWVLGDIEETTGTSVGFIQIVRYPDIYWVQVDLVGCFKGPAQLEQMVSMAFSPREMAMANQAGCRGDMIPPKKPMRLGKAVLPKWAFVPQTLCVGALGYPRRRPSRGSLVLDRPWLRICHQILDQHHPLAAETMMDLSLILESVNPLKTFTHG